MNRFPMNLDALDAEVVPSVPIAIISADREVEWNGRVRVGSEAHLGIRTVSVSSYNSNRVVNPDTNPVVRIYAGSAPVRSYAVPVDPTAFSSIGVFRGLFTPGGLDSPCHAIALFAYLVGGVAKEMASVFEIIPGGNPNGPVNSTFNVDLPSGSDTIAFQGSGRVTFGKRAYLDTGSTEV